MSEGCLQADPDLIGRQNRVLLQPAPVDLAEL